MGNVFDSSPILRIDSGMKSLLSHLRPTYGQKLFMLATLPLVLAVTAIALVVANQARELANREIQQLEHQLIATKRAELRNYVTQARNGFYFVYGNARPDDEDAKEQIKQILAAMIYGEEGFFFVYEYDGTNLVSPRQTDLINGEWWDLEDSEGKKVIQEFVQTARQGAGWVEHMWPKPSTGEEARMITYVMGFQDWQWAVGTGVFIDDILETVAASRAVVQARVHRTFVYIGVITGAALLLVFSSGWLINIRERRLADVKLKRLTQRVFDAQEEERGRVARELHDGISQILVGVRYALEVARKRMSDSDTSAKEMLDKGTTHLSVAISEVRRISRDLRPGVLDDLGLGPALKALADDFATRTGITTRFDTVVFRNRLKQDAKIGLYRIAQEALTNIERHASATEVTIDLRGHRSGATMRISDNGCGIDPSRSSAGGGLGLRNMQERIEQLGGTLELTSSKTGTTIAVMLPLSHILSPERDTDMETGGTQ